MSELYQRHANEMAGDVVPESHLKSIVNELMISASCDMGNDFEDQTLDRVVELIRVNYKYLPVYMIASAFKKGALGHYGSGRLIPRTIYGWLNESAMEFNRHQAHEKNAEESPTEIFKNFRKYPLGKAIERKIDWLTSDMITEQEYDMIPLKKLAEMIGSGTYPTPEHFGIKPKQ